MIKTWVKKSVLALNHITLEERFFVQFLVWNLHTFKQSHCYTLNIICFLKI